MDKYKKQRKRMVETQLKTRDIYDDRVLKAMETIPRHLFVDEGLMEQAYNDNPLPIDAHQTISQPYIVALMTQALELKPTDRVLEIGTWFRLSDSYFSLSLVSCFFCGKNCQIGH